MTRWKDCRLPKIDTAATLGKEQRAQCTRRLSIKIYMNRINCKKLPFFSGDSISI